jgi:hypothetical protein
VVRIVSPVAGNRWRCLLDPVSWLAGVALPLAAAATVRLLRSRLCFGSRRIPLEYPGPVEFDLGVVLFDQADGVFVQRGAADPDAWRGAEPIEYSRARPAPPSFRVDEECVLVAALVAAEPEVRQGLLPFLGPRCRFSRGGLAALCRRSGGLTCRRALGRGPSGR